MNAYSHLLRKSITPLSLSFSISLSPFVLMAVFPGGLGYQCQNVSTVDFIRAKMMEVLVTNWAVGCAKLHASHHHQQPNTQLYTGRMLFLLLHQQCWSMVAYLQQNYFHRMTSGSVERNSILTYWRLLVMMRTQGGRSRMSVAKAWLLPMSLC